MKLPYTLVALCLASMVAALPASTTSPTTTTTISKTHEVASTPTATGTQDSLPSTGCLRRRQSSPEDDPPSYVAIVTAAPTQDEALASLGWVQTTYYECRTLDGTEHCGWHIPVAKKGSAGAANRGSAWSAAVAAAGVVGWMVI